MKETALQPHDGVKSTSFKHDSQAKRPSHYQRCISVSKSTRCLTSTETVRLIRDGEKVGEGGMEVGGEGDYIPIATLSPPE